MQNTTSTKDYLEQMLKIDDLCSYCGNCHSRTIDRWIDDAGFPNPYYIKNIRFWKLSEVAAWFEIQPRKATTTPDQIETRGRGRKKGQRVEARQKAAATRRKRSALQRSA